MKEGGRERAERGEKERKGRRGVGPIGMKRDGKGDEDGWG